MEPTLIPALVVLIASAVLLIFVSAAEAAVGAISRTRVQSPTATGLSDLLQSYVRQRQRILRALNTAGSLAIIAMTISLVLIAASLSEPGTRAEVVAGVAALILMFSSLYVVHQAQLALVVQVGEPRQVVTEPGLHIKAPWPLQNVVYVDKRVLNLDLPTEEVIAQDKKLTKELAAIAKHRPAA